MKRRLFAASVAVLGLLVFAGAAGAATLGITAPPSGAGPTACFATIAQDTDTPSAPYIVPRAGEITQWQTYTASDTAGSSLTFAVLRLASTNTYTVVGTDTETLPTPLPSNHIASFTLAQPIQVAAGDTLALYSSSTDTCYFTGGSTPTGDSLLALSGTLPLASGESLTETMTSGGGFTLNVAATLIRPEDAGVQASVFPTMTDVAGGALLKSVVTNNGPFTDPITFVDQVPSGLQIQSASAGLGTCSVAGQTVTCTVSGLPVGQSTFVDVVVAPTAVASYTNNVSVSVPSTDIDQVPGNNSASTTLAVTALPQECIVPGSLRKVPQAAAGTLLTELGCRVHVARQHSGIAKGLVLNVRGGARAYPYHQIVTLDVSSGPKKKAKKHKRH